jgi:repressor LexA
MVRGLSGRQQQLLDLIDEGIRVRGSVPTLRELGERMGGISPSAVHLQLGALAKKGVLRWPRGRPREIEVLRRGAARAGRVGTEPEGAATGPLAVPVVGTIAAGPTLDAREAPDGHVLVEPGQFRSGPGGREDLFALRVRGDSMVDACIQDGDLVVIRRQDTAADGETVVALLEGEQVTLKRFYREAERVRLQPANPYYPAIFAKDVRIQGIVVGVVRYC